MDFGDSIDSQTKEILQQMKIGEIKNIKINNGIK